MAGIAKTPVVRSAQVLVCHSQGRKRSPLAAAISLPKLNRANTSDLLSPPHCLALDLGQPGPGKILDLGMQRQPGFWEVIQVVWQWPLLALTQIAPPKQPRLLTVAQLFELPQPTCCNPQSYLSNHSSPTHTMSKYSTRSGMTTTEEKMQPWAASEWSCRHLHKQHIRPL